MYSGCPATVPPTRRPTDVRKTSDSQISHAIPPVQESTHAQIPQNINDSITRSEIQSGELHAKLMRTRWRGLAGLRANAPHISDLAPLVWRAPEGAAAVPVGGGGAWPGFESTRRAKLAARTARGRAAAHRHTQRPGPTAPGTPVRPQVARPTHNNHTTTRACQRGGYRSTRPLSAHSATASSRLRPNDPQSWRRRRIHRNMPPTTAAPRPAPPIRPSKPVRARPCFGLVAGTSGAT